MPLGRLHEKGKHRLRRARWLKDLPPTLTSAGKKGIMKQKNELAADPCGKQRKG